jgi:hypothetical protein
VDRGVNALPRGLLGGQAGFVERGGALSQLCLKLGSRPLDVSLRLRAHLCNATKTGIG